MKWKLNEIILKENGNEMKWNEMILKENGNEMKIKYAMKLNEIKIKIKWNEMKVKWKWNEMKIKWMWNVNEMKWNEIKMNMQWNKTNLTFVCQSSISDMLALGKSKPWPDAMEAITGQRGMSADAILQYFQPLMEWLEKENAANGDVIGWPAYDASTQEPTVEPVEPTTARSMFPFLFLKPSLFRPYFWFTNPVTALSRPKVRLFR